MNKKEKIKLKKEITNIVTKPITINDVEQQLYDLVKKYLGIEYWKYEKMFKQTIDNMYYISFINTKLIYNLILNILIENDL